MNEYDTPELLAVPVRGGDLTVAKWGGGATTVIAAHGLSVSHREWPFVAEQLGGDVTFLAPDLRGRGNSAHLPGPFGMWTHADDLVAVLDHVGAAQAVVVGHSMGAWVAAATAESHPLRVQGLVLIDGAVPLPIDIPEGMSIDEVLEMVVGPSVDRLRTVFPSREAYHDFWRAHPALGPAWSERVAMFVDYDLTGTEPELRAKTSLEAVREDAGANLVDEKASTAIERVTCPTVLLWAERGMLDQTPGLYTQDLIDGYAARLTHLEAHMVPDVNHWTVVMTEAGAATVAQHIRRAAGLA